MSKNNLKIFTFVVDRKKDGIFANKKVAPGLYYFERLYYFHKHKDCYLTDYF